jgi:phosphoserine phosphatase
MIFSRKHAGKWVASKGDKVVAVTASLQTLLKKIERRKDKDTIRFDLVPPNEFFAGQIHGM